MKKIIYITLLSLLMGILSGCSTSINNEEPSLSPVGKTKKSGSVLNYSLTELKEIDLTESSNIDTDADNVWQRIVDGYQLEQGINPRIQREIDFYRTRPKTIPEVLTRAKPYLYMIVNEIKKRNMPMEIVLLPVIESAFHPKALSGANASGIWQFTPDTAKIRGIKNDWWYDGRRDVYESTNAALDYLQNLHDRSDNDWLLALAGYNWGILNVKAAIAKNRAKNLPTDYWSLKLPGETQRYVPKLLAIARMIQTPEQYGLNLPDVPNVPYLTRIEIDQQIDLATAAQMADMSWDDFHRFNAGHKRVTTDPGATTHVLVPVEKLRTFAINLAKFAPQTQSNWISHTLSIGDNINELAMRYDTTADMIVKANSLKQLPVVGQTLLIPVGQKTMDEKTEAQAQATLATTLSLESRKQANKRAMAEKKELAKQNKIVHVLKSNQPLGWLAKHYGVPLASLAKMNNLTTESKLRVGQQLIIPVQKVTSITAKKGDTWGSIAKKNNLPAYLLASFNDAKEKEAIKPGQTVKIPKLG